MSIFNTELDDFFGSTERAKPSKPNSQVSKPINELILERPWRFNPRVVYYESAQCLGN